MASEWRQYVNKLIATEISTFSKYFDRLFHFKPRIEDTGILYREIECPEKSVANIEGDIPDCTGEKERRTIVLINGNVNHDFDIQGTLQGLRQKLARTSRVVLVAYNPYFSWLYRLANRWGIRSGEEPTTFLTHTALSNIAQLSGFDVVRVRSVAYCPWKAFGLGDLLNRILPTIPVLNWFHLVSIVMLRPIVPETGKPKITILIPARNEKGNIENALKRIPSFGGASREIMFVEGHSNDDTWGEIQRVLPLYRDRFELAAFQQTGKGKADAVRLGFSKATGDLLVILDADLTMPPELLERFYDAYCQGHADFINGNRLVYPMEGNAMKFLNHLGNVFFAKALSMVLGVRIGDSLCGTKLVARHDYQRMIAWRNDFGDFDPFGDFELIFPASILGMGIVDIAMRYRDRVYGTTNIRRFYHGWMLLRMTLIGFFRVTLGRGTRA